MSLFACLVADPNHAPASGALEVVARACSPRVRSYGETAVLFDVAGLARAIGAPVAIAAEIAQLASQQELSTRLAVARTRTSAWLLAHAKPGITVVPPGDDANLLASLPLGWLGTIADYDRAERVDERPLLSHLGLRTADVTGVLAILERWGLRTLGDVAALPRADVRARLGVPGVRLHQAASGMDVAPFVPVTPTVRFREETSLEWPIEALEPLAFVLARQCDRLSSVLERADRGAIMIHTRLRLVTRASHERVLRLPAPIRDARVWRALILLDLESHPPPAGIDAVEIELGVAPGRIMHGALFAPMVPSPEDLVTLTARLGALMGASRVGSPRLLDTYDARAVAIMPYRLAGSAPSVARPDTGPPIRRLRLPIAASVTVDRGAPMAVHPSARGLPGGRIRTRAGPWRSSGGWWALDRPGWDRDEWDVELEICGIYRLVRDRAAGTWTVDGILD